MTPSSSIGNFALWLLFAVLNTTICCCKADDRSPTSAKAIPSETKPLPNLHSITLPHFEPELSDAAGRDEYQQVCVSCHSPLYVMMQPPFPQRQWEETVDKMAKVYGAQMDQDQRASVIQYLVVTHGPDSARAPARDDDSDFAPTPKLNLISETAPVLPPIPDGPGHAKVLEHGAELYNRNCASCHGQTGRGDGFVAPVLLRKPKNLAAIRYSFHFLSRVLWYGKRGTAMPSWRGFAQNDLTALAAYVQSLHPPAGSDQVSSDSLQHGKLIFLQNCAPCHGETGDGKGPAAAVLIPEPANFKLKQPDYDYILGVLNEGIPGTAMPAWNQQISEPDRRALADFLRSFFKEDSSNEP